MKRKINERERKEEGREQEGEAEAGRIKEKKRGREGGSERRTVMGSHLVILNRLVQKRIAKGENTICNISKGIVCLLVGWHEEGACKREKEKNHNYVGGL